MTYEQLAREGLILAQNVQPFLSDSRALRRDVDNGRLYKLRRGAYVERSTWEALEPAARHVLRVRAVVEMAQRLPIVAGISAAALWGMPIAGDWPDEVTLIDEWLGGGRSEPGIRRTAMGFRTLQTATVQGIRVTSIARTALQVARTVPFANAVGSVDWALWRKNPHAVTLETLRDELRALNPRTRFKHLERICEFSTPLSDSYGESQARAVIHLLGFHAPQLQVVFTDAQGNMYVDFFWPEVRVAGEFDGKMKYTRNDLTLGNPGQVVWEEKKREDRLRRQVSGVVRILTSDVLVPKRLEALLLETGVPRYGGRNFFAAGA